MLIVLDEGYFISFSFFKISILCFNLEHNCNNCHKVSGKNQTAWTERGVIIYILKVYSAVEKKAVNAINTVKTISNHEMNYLSLFEFHHAYISCGSLTHLIDVNRQSMSVNSTFKITHYSCQERLLPIFSAVSHSFRIDQFDLKMEHINKITFVSFYEITCIKCAFTTSGP